MRPIRDSCRGAVLLLLDYFWITLTCNMTGAAGGAGHVTLLVHMAPLSFFVRVYIASALVYFVYCLIFLIFSLYM